MFNVKDLIHAKKNKTKSRDRDLLNFFSIFETWEWSENKIYKYKDETHTESKQERDLERGRVISF